MEETFPKQNTYMDNTKTTVSIVYNHTVKNMKSNNINDNWSTTNFNTTNELTLGTLVWVADKKEGWLAAQVVSIDYSKNSSELVDDTPITIQIDSFKKQSLVTRKLLHLRNPRHVASEGKGVDDLTQLQYLNEPSILFNIRTRYLHQNIYSYSGFNILIAVNPFESLDMLYSKEMIESYRQDTPGESKLSPHVFAIAQSAFASMMQSHSNQSILISGESAAGKTQTSKFLLDFFAAMGSHSYLQNFSGTFAHTAPTSITRTHSFHGHEHEIIWKVVESTILLEAFGNAKTQRNDNSSRFGKFVDLKFDNTGCIIGAWTHIYLLERSRVVLPSQDERSFHIFYHLLSGAQNDLKAKLQLSKASNYAYLNQTKCYLVNSISDSVQFGRVEYAMDSIGYSSEEQLNIWSTLAAILHIGNIQFTDHYDKEIGSDTSSIDNEATLRIAAELLGIQDPDVIAQLGQAFVSREVSVGPSEVYKVPLNSHQAQVAADALSMCLYSKLFSWLVVRLNELMNTLENMKRTMASIGLLDLYGFEYFECNGFEQFCINYSNEKLQQQFIKHVFKAEIQVYEAESISYNDITFSDNQACLDLIEGKDMKTVCLLDILDEESRINTATCDTLSLKLQAQFNKNKYYRKPVLPAHSFAIQHYAGEVIYDTNLGFLERNKDYIIPEFAAVLTKSSNPFIRDLFGESQIEPEAEPKSRRRQSVNMNKTKANSIKFTSVVSQFKESLNTLLAVIDKTNPHYIKCIRPNEWNSPRNFQNLMVLHQLKCSGIIDAVHINLEGFPYRVPFYDFANRYYLIGAKTWDRMERERKVLAEFSVQILRKANIHESKYQIGQTKVFLRSGQVELVEKKRMEILNIAAAVIQSKFRMHSVIKRFELIKKSAMVIQHVTRGFLATQSLKRAKRERATSMLQSHIRTFIARTTFLKAMKSAIVLQATVRTYRVQKEYKQHAEALVTQTIENTRKREEELQIRVDLLQHEIVEMNQAARAKDVILHSQRHQMEEQQQTILKQQRAMDDLHRQLIALTEQLKKSQTQLTLEQDLKQAFIQELQVTKKELEIANLTNETNLEEIGNLKKQIVVQKEQNATLSTNVRNLRKKVVRLAVEPKVAQKIRNEELDFANFIVFDLPKKPGLKFIGGTIPVPAYLVFMYLSFCKSVEFNYATFFLRVLYNIHQDIGANLNNDNVMIYWLSNCALLFFLINNDDEQAEEYRLDEIELPQTSDDTIETDQLKILEAKGGQEPYWLCMKLLVENILLLYLRLLKRLVFVLDPIIVQLLFERPSYSRQDKRNNGVLNMTQVIKPFLQLVKENFIHPRLVKLLFTHIFDIVEAKLLNTFLVRKDLCNVEQALNIKLNLALLEDAVMSEGVEWIGHMEHKFLRFKEALTVILIDKREVNVEAFPHLNGVQIRQLLLKYQPQEEFEETIPIEVLKRVEASIQGNDAMLMPSFQLVPPICLQHLAWLDPNDIFVSSIPSSLQEKIPFTFVKSDARNIILQAKDLTFTTSLNDSLQDHLTSPATNAPSVSLPDISSNISPLRHIRKPFARTISGLITGPVSPK